MSGFVEKRSNGRFYARWRDPSGRLKAKSFKLERDAKAYLAAQQVAVARGVYVDERSGKITFAEWAEHYFAIAGKRLARTSKARDLDHLRNHLLPKWGNVQIGRITKPAVERWVADLSEPRDPRCPGVSARRSASSTSARSPTSPPPSIPGTRRPSTS